MTLIARSRYGYMEGGTTAAKPAFEVYGPAEIHVTGEPNKPEPGTLFDNKGETVEIKRGLMVKIDAKASEKVELSKGTLAAIAVIPALLLVLFNYGAGALGWARDDEAGRVKITNIERQVDSIEAKLDDINNKLIEQRVKDAETRGYTLGQTDAGATGHKGEK